MMYVGLTDDPVRRRAEHGYPMDWQQMPIAFATEAAARAWEAAELSKPGRQGGKVGAAGATVICTRSLRAPENSMRDHWGNPIGEAREDALARTATDLTRRELRELIGDAVFGGVLKAVGVYLLITAIIAFLIELVRAIW